MGWNLADPQSLNLYAYVQDNPINDVDPTGHCDIRDGESLIGCTFDSEESAIGEGLSIEGVDNPSGRADFPKGPDNEGMKANSTIQDAARAGDTQTQQEQSGGSYPPPSPDPCTTTDSCTVKVHGDCYDDPGCNPALTLFNRASGVLPTPPGVLSMRPPTAAERESERADQEEACAGRGAEAAGKDLIMYDEFNAVATAMATGTLSPLKELFSGGTAATAVGKGAGYVATHRAAQKAIKAATAGELSANAAGRLARRTGKAAALVGLALAAYTGYKAYQGCMKP